MWAANKIQSSDPEPTFIGGATRTRHNIYVCIYLSIYIPFVGPWPIFQLLNPIHSRWDSFDRGSARRKAAAYTQNKRTQISMFWLEFEPTIPAFVWEKKVHALDRAATVIGIHLSHCLKFVIQNLKLSTIIMSIILNHELQWRQSLYKYTI
jgi:hypothetical protein